jgi:hypothetical protein
MRNTIEYYLMTHNHLCDTCSQLNCYRTDKLGRMYLRTLG